MERVNKYEEITTRTTITYHRLYKFGKLFELNNLNIKLLEKSLSPEANREQVFQAGEGTGKSGSFFFFSHDRKFMIKTMRNDEFETMLKILPDYIEHHRRYPDSLLAKIFGVFTVKKEGMEKVHLMLMENTMQFKDKNKIKFVYDLKGSTYGRRTKGTMTTKTVRKDLDFLNDKKKNPRELSLAKINRVLIQTLRRDVNFLKEKNLIDYSLLLAIEKTDEEFDQKKIEESRRLTKMVST